MDFQVALEESSPCTNTVQGVGRSFAGSSVAVVDDVGEWWTIRVYKDRDEVVDMAMDNNNANTKAISGSIVVIVLSIDRWIDRFGLKSQDPTSDEKRRCSMCSIKPSQGCFSRVTSHGQQRKNDDSHLPYVTIGMYIRTVP